MHNQIPVSAEVNGKTPDMALSQPYANTSPHISHNRFGPYQIDEVLGQGAVAMVYAAKNQRGQPRVLKVLMRQAAAQRTVRVGFQREFQVLHRLRHRNIVHAYQTGEVDGYYYMTLDRIDGEILDDFLLAQKKSVNNPPSASSLKWPVHSTTCMDRIRPSRYQAIQYPHWRRDGRAVLFDFGTVLNFNNTDEEDTIGVSGTPAFLRQSRSTMIQLMVVPISMRWVSSSIV